MSKWYTAEAAEEVYIYDSSAPHAFGIPQCAPIASFPYDDVLAADLLCAAHNAATQPGIVWNTNMEDAPKDGTRVLVAWSHSLVPEHMQYETVRWNPTEGWWVSGYCCILPRSAVAWAPINWPEVTP